MASLNFGSILIILEVSHSKSAASRSQLVEEDDKLKRQDAALRYLLIEKTAERDKEGKRQQSVKLASNEELTIIKEDVHLTMGFPKGCKPIKGAKKSDKGDYKRRVDLPVDATQHKAYVQKISRSLKKFARSVVEVVDAMSEAQQMFPASIQMDNIQGVLVEILSNYSKLGTFKVTTGKSQTQPRDVNVGHQVTPSSQDEELFVSD
ncbi:hypothetical protein Cgig2_028701 [Carnegiea gigantea]|uniref:Uncharacterized protein n=1 Tax=Carnegiea gigantea TaxID=171969 RepID=A0A9Q1KC86_9CARY|nr:hypothetical protein Cgig2_028701 [Carnegiea gigantea]